MSEPSETTDDLLRSLDRRAPLAGLLAVGAFLLFVPWALQSWLTAHARLTEGEQDAVGVALDDLDQEIAGRQALRDVVARDLSVAKKNAASLSKSRRALFEGSLALSEEKRLLEKQWES